MNLLIANTRSEAEHWMEVFGLSTTKWLPRGIGDALSGRTFDKIANLSHYTDPISIKWLEHAYSKKSVRSQKKG